jgi:hypothetical protein
MLVLQGYFMEFSTGLVCVIQLFVSKDNLWHIAVYVHPEGKMKVVRNVSVFLILYIQFCWGLK